MSSSRSVTMTCLVAQFREEFKRLGYDTIMQPKASLASSKELKASGWMVDPRHRHVISDPLYHPNPNIMEAFILCGKHQAVHVRSYDGDCVFDTYASKTHIPPNIGFEALHAKTTNWSLEDHVANASDVPHSLLSWCSQNGGLGRLHIVDVITKHMQLQREGELASLGPALSDYSNHLNWCVRTGFISKARIRTYLTTLTANVLKVID